MANLHHVKNSRISAIGRDSIDQLNQLFGFAYHIGASDIHFDVGRDIGWVALRFQGRISYKTPLSIGTLRQIIGRMKLLSHMRSDISDRGQDGAGFMELNHLIFFRSATSPTVHGENMVCRLFGNEGKSTKTLLELGLQASDYAIFIDNLKKDSGLVLVSGPTGSGKTTTLYACLQHLVSLGKMVISVEDPVEVVLPQVRQIKINRDIGYDFKDALKGVLRQDPDVIMVGEIRDSETAHLAIQAALTGHLVLATVHAPSALEIVDRLKSLGISPSQLIPITQLLVYQKSVFIKGQSHKVLFECVPMDRKLRHIFGCTNTHQISDAVRDAGVLLLKDQLLAYKENGLISKEDFEHYIRS